MDGIFMQIRNHVSFYMEILEIEDLYVRGA